MDSEFKTTKPMGAGFQISESTGLILIDSIYWGVNVGCATFFWFQIRNLWVILGMFVLVHIICRYLQKRWSLFRSVFDESDQENAAKITPEQIGILLQFFLTPSVRERCFEPFFEDLKQDRLKAAAIAKTPLSKFIVEIAFQFRLIMSFLAALFCMIREVFPLGEIVRSFFKIGGR